MSGMLDEIVQRIEELERRLANTVRLGRVIEVDAGRGLVRLQVNELETDWLPWTTQAGEINVFVPPSVGQQMMLVSPSGEPGQGWAVPAGFSNQFAQPHDQAGEMKVTHGGVSIFSDGDVLKVTAPKVEVHANEALVEADRLDLGAAGGPAVARIGDSVSCGAVITSGSGRVFAAD